MKFKKGCNFGISIYNDSSLENYLIELEKFERRSKKIFFDSIAKKLKSISF